MTEQEARCELAKILVDENYYDEEDEELQEYVDGCIDFLKEKDPTFEIYTFESVVEAASFPSVHTIEDKVKEQFLDCSQEIRELLPYIDMACIASDYRRRGTYYETKGGHVVKLGDLRLKKVVPPKKTYKVSTLVKASSASEARRIAANTIYRADLECEVVE